MSHMSIDPAVMAALCECQICLERRAERRIVWFDHHGDRQAVIVPEVSAMAYLRFFMRNGFPKVSR